MAKNITLLGASYSDVPAVNLPQTGGGTARFTDTSVTTAVESDVASGKIFIKADGSQATGTGSGGGGTGAVWQDQQGYINLDDEAGGSITVEPLSVTTNATYTAPAGKAYSPVTVNVSGGGGGDFTMAELTVENGATTEYILVVPYIDNDIMYSYISSTDLPYQVQKTITIPLYKGQAYIYLRTVDEAYYSVMMDGDISWLRPPASFVISGDAYLALCNV